QSIQSLDTHLSAIGEVKDNYFVQTANIRTLLNRISKKAKLELERNDIKERLLEFNEKGYQTILIKQQDAETEHSLLQQVINDLEQKENHLREFIEGFTYLDFDTFKFSADAEDELRMIL